MKILTHLIADDHFSSYGVKFYAQVGSNCQTDDDCASLYNSKCGVDHQCVCTIAHFESALGYCVPGVMLSYDN